MVVFGHLCRIGRRGRWTWTEVGLCWQLPGFYRGYSDHVESEIGLPAGFRVCDEFYARGELDGVEGVRFYINSRRVVVIESIYEAV